MSAELVELQDRILAAKRRIGDLKARHTEWYGKAPCMVEREEEVKLINDMEAIAYSVWCYLDGLDGPYRKSQKD